jgi:hypothetical protein
MRLIILISVLFYGAVDKALAECPNQQGFIESGWVVHDGENFHQILKKKLNEFLPQVGKDLVLDNAEFYKSDYSHNHYLIMWVVIWDRLSTDKEEMWGDVAVTMTGPNSEKYIEIRWYDPVHKKKHIVCNPDYVCCLSTNVPLAYNCIF